MYIFSPPIHQSMIHGKPVHGTVPRHVRRVKRGPPEGPARTGLVPFSLMAAGLRSCSSASVSLITCLVPIQVGSLAAMYVCIYKSPPRSQHHDGPATQGTSLERYDTARPCMPCAAVQKLASSRDMQNNSGSIHSDISYQSGRLPIIVGASHESIHIDWS